MDNIYLPLAKRSWAQLLENFTILQTVNAWKTYFNGLKFRGTNFREPAKRTSLEKNLKKIVIFRVYLGKLTNLVKRYSLEI